MEFKHYNNQTKLTTVRLVTDPVRNSYNTVHGILLGSYISIYNTSWKDSGDIDCIIYSIRQKYTNLPYDDKVLVLLCFKGLTKILVHESELVEEISPTLSPSNQLSYLAKTIAYCKRCFKHGDLQYFGLKFRVCCTGSCHSLTNNCNTPEEAIAEWNNQNL